MKKLILLVVLIALVFIKLPAQTEPFNKRTVVNSGMGLQGPWECVYGPNDSLFVTESKGYLVRRISTNTTPGVATTILDISNQNDEWATGTGPQGGLMGIALHPALYSTNYAVRNAKPWVYIAFVYHKTGPTNCLNPGVAGGCPFVTKIVRYDYFGNTLSNPTIVLDNIPGSSDHNSGRLVIGPNVEGTQYRLYYTVGDMGAGQLTNTNRVNNAQQLDVMEGKVLRLNTEVDGDAGLDAWVPNDNFYYNGAPITPRDYVYSMGHRNPQGLVWGVVAGTPRLYSSEQSDRADDEINLIVAGNNYGWDKVSGACDGDVNGFKIGGQNVANEVGNCAGTTQPMFTTFHHNTTWPSTYPANGSPNANWPTIASSSIEYYGKNVIPGWPGSLLITPLKEDRVYRLKLDASGTAIPGDTISYFRGDGNRIRRVMSDPTGLKFYVVRDNNTIMEYTYTGITLPVRLLYFRGILQDNATQLEWSTSAETNSDHFVIERSLDGVSYTDIGTVKSTGNSSVNNVYTYSDINAVTQQGNIIYYRLRMVDIDGSTKYSNVVSISLNEKVEKISVVPNPVQGISKVYITVINGGTANWKVVDNSGVVVMQNNLQLKPGANSLSLDMTRLAAGIYYLNVSGPGINQKVKLQKL